MKQISINGVGRTELGKKAAKHYRKNEEVPCVLYGEKRDENGNPVAIHFTVKYNELSKLVFTPHIYLIDITIDGVDHKAVLREVQFHPVKDTILHVDFYEVHPEKPIIMAVPIATQGLAEGVRAGGKLTSQVRKLKVRALYEQIPEKLTIDVSHLGLAQSIKVGDLHFEGLEIVTPKEVVVVAVKMTRAAMGAAAAAAKADK